MSFPQGFIWGAASSSYQIEGAAGEDGKGPSVWDVFCCREWSIAGGQSGQTACDHYHRYEDDVSLFKEIGLNSYRFSISWPRILPQGTGRVNAKGLDFYDRLVDRLLAAGISPCVTLFHWDYPQELYLRGGWLDRDSPDWFMEYARVVVDRLSDRVERWITLNEPQCFVGLGLEHGFHAPGDKVAVSQALAAAHNVLLAHGKAVQVIRSVTGSRAKIGFAPVGVVNLPVSESRADIEAARQAMFAIPSKTLWNNTWWADPIFLGTYPEDGWELYGANVPDVREGDMKTINQPLDFFGVNIYFGQLVRAGENGSPEIVGLPQGHARTAFFFPVMPEALRWGTRFFWERYGLPVIITENGMSNIDWIALDGKVHDPQRIDFTHRYLLELKKAWQDGAEIAGYYHWSVMDNFEWTEGYKERFGLIHVDYQSQKRTLKDSARWYSEVIASNGASLEKTGYQAP